MSEYVVDILTQFYRLHPADGSCGSSWKQYMIKIDNKGNVVISQNFMNTCSGHSPTYSGFGKILEINDNIPIPTYLISIIKQMFTSTYQKTRIGNYSHLYNDHWEIIIDTLKLLKQEIKQITENPQNILDINNQLETYITKFKLQEEMNSTLENKIENIQKAYFDTLNDNKKLKDESKILKEQITRLENEIKNRKDIVYINVPYENLEPKSLKNCWSNPGGATIYTKPNASNKMVYNETSGIYEPEEI